MPLKEDTPFSVMPFNVPEAVRTIGAELESDFISGAVAVVCWECPVQARKMENPKNAFFIMAFMCFSLWYGSSFNIHYKSPLKSLVVLYTDSCFPYQYR